MKFDKGGMKVPKRAKDVFEFLDELRSEEGLPPLTLAEELYEEALATVGGALMAYRKEHNLTQKQLADILGTTENIVARIENGRLNLSLKKLAEIGAKLTGKFKISFGILEDD